MWRFGKRRCFVDTMFDLCSQRKTSIRMSRVSLIFVYITKICSYINAVNVRDSIALIHEWRIDALYKKDNKCILINV